MPSFTYYEDVSDFDEVEISDEDIRSCDDMDTLLEWLALADAVSADIKAQVEVAGLAGQPDLVWVYRAGKALGFQRRAQTRIQHRLVALGWTPTEAEARITRLGRRIDELNRKVGELRSAAPIAIEFHRLCMSGEAKIGRAEFERIEGVAIENVARRNRKEAA